MNTNAAIMEVSNATLKIEDDVILISDHKNTVRFNHDAATELWKLLPALISKLPSNLSAICERIVDECEAGETNAESEDEKLYMRGYAAGARRMLRDIVANNN